MPLLMVRIDSRLVHGQVVETWLPHVGANCLLVANDDLASNPALRSVMALAVPPSVHTLFCALDDAPETLAGIDCAGEKAIMLCATFDDALRLLRAGVRFPSLNIGNLHYGPGKVEITPSVYFSPEDFEAIHTFRHKGVAVNVRATPFEAGLSFEPERK